MASGVLDCGDLTEKPMGGGALGMGSRKREGGKVSGGGYRYVRTGGPEVALFRAFRCV